MTGWAIGQGGLGVVAATGLPSALVGFTLTTALTSLPELAVLITAVRMGHSTSASATSSAGTSSTP